MRASSRSIAVVARFSSCPSRRVSSSCFGVRTVRFMLKTSRWLELMSSASVLFLWLLHSVGEQRPELVANLLGFALELMQQLALLVINFAIGKQQPPQPGGLLAVDPAVRQDMVLDGLVIEVLERRGE